MVEIHLATCTPNFLIQESIETFGGFYAEIVKKQIQWQDGYIIPPTEPGIGVELDETVADAHPCTEESVSPLCTTVPSSASSKAADKVDSR